MKNNIPRFGITGKRGQFIISSGDWQKVFKDENKVRLACRENKGSRVYEWMYKDWMPLCHENRGHVVNDYI